MIVCAGNNESFAFAKAIGIGLVDSAIGLMQLCTKEVVSSLVFIGSAGAYSDDIKIGDMFIADSASNIELSFLQEKSYTPIDNHIQSGILKAVSYETLTQTIVNSSNYISTDNALSSQFLKAGILLENMEFYAALKVAQYFSVPCVGIFCVSNYCNSDAHSDFIANASLVKQTLIAHKDMIKAIDKALQGFNNG